MSQIHCNVIQDLLPLYIDSTCSPETTDLVNAHLEGCLECRVLLDTMTSQLPSAPPSPAFGSDQLFRTVRKTLLGIILAASVMISCFICNIGGAWYGGPANLGQLLVTIIYIIFWGVFTVVSRQFSPLVKVSLIISLLTLLSSANSLFWILLGGGGFIAAFCSAFVSVPFYGLRFFVEWEALYVIATLISLGWLVYTEINLRKVQKLSSKH